MEDLDSFGALVGSVTASLVPLGFAILSFFVTVFVVDAEAGPAGFSTGGDFVVLSAAPMVRGRPSAWPLRCPASAARRSSRDPLRS
jgi:hypothetical protein